MIFLLSALPSGGYHGVSVETFIYFDSNNLFFSFPTYVALSLGQLFSKDGLDGLRHLSVETTARLLFTLLSVCFLEIKHTNTNIIEEPIRAQLS